MCILLLVYVVIILSLFCYQIVLFELLIEIFAILFAIVY